MLYLCIHWAKLIHSLGIGRFNCWVNCSLGVRRPINLSASQEYFRRPNNIGTYFNRPDFEIFLVKICVYVYV